MCSMHYQRDTFPADAEHAHTAREQLRRWLATARVPENVTYALVLAASEALDNAVIHAYSPRGKSRPRPARRAHPAVEMTMLVDPNEVLITVTDFGSWRDPATSDLEHDVAGHPAEHGRGITLMVAHVDEVAIRHDAHGTTVLLRLARRGVQAQSVASRANAADRETRSS